MILNRIILTILLLFVVFLAIPTGTAANPQYEGRMAVVLVIDGSGSMIHNDPERVRVEAAQRTVGILKDEDCLSVIEFSTEARQLMPMRQVGGEAGRQEIGELIAEAGQRGDTDILSGLRSAYHQLEGAPPDARKFVILLSDGESDVPGLTSTAWGREQYFADTETLLGRYQEQGWAVHCIAFHEEGAGPELEHIAGKTGGEYQFATSADELKNIFASILLAAKYPPGVQPRFHASVQGQDGYAAGDDLVAEACLTIGEDRVLPGPYLSLGSMDLVVTSPDGTATVPFVEGEDGWYHAEVRLDSPGEYEFSGAVTAEYRGVPIAESAALDPLVVVERGDPGLPAVNAEQLLALSTQAARVFPAAIYLPPAVIILLLVVRVYRRDRVRGELTVWVDTGRNVRYSKYRFRLGKAGRREIRIGTEMNRDTNFRVEPLDRPFGFMIRAVRDPFQAPQAGRLRRLFWGPKMLYEVVCMPGTAIQAGERLKTRDNVYNGDSFEIGGYVFELKAPGIGKRPCGENVLEAYQPPPPAAAPGKRILTLRVINREK